MAGGRGRSRVARSAAVATAALLFGFGPVAAANAAGDSAGSGSSTVVVARWTVNVKCPVERISDLHIVDVVYGTGTGSTHASAKSNALRDANNQIPRGHRAHHCREI
ncbi:hypothetical protein [Embleya sp. NPDC059237]|uniref:hypothetical protein n=1 Tax=Embleya sp. NPDC059237 TaxID=3346784 RepID=UPI003677C6C2